MIGQYRDRRHAGRVLAEKLGRYGGREDVVVLALPRGGVPVAYEVARNLGAPLDVLVVRKLGVPFHPELAMGAIASGGVKVLDQSMVDALRIPPGAVQRVVEVQERELQRRETAYRGEVPPLDVKGRVAILVDDGLATGSTMRAAARAVRQHGPSQVIVAVPVAAAETCDEIGAEVDDIVCGLTPEPFYAVGLWYEDFERTTDAEVRSLIAAAREPERSRVQQGGHHGLGRG